MRIGQAHRLGIRHATPLENTQYRTGAGGFNAQAQGKGGRLRQCPARAQHETAAAPLLGGKLQAPAIAISQHAGKPAQHGAAGGFTQRLLHGPLRIVGVAHNYPGQVAQMHPGSLPGRRVGDIGRGHQHDLALLPAKAGQRRQQQAQLAAAITRRYQLGNRRLRPAAAGQDRAQRSVASIDYLRFGSRKSIAAPDAGMLEQILVDALIEGCRLHGGGLG